MNWQQECQQNTFISGNRPANWRMDFTAPVIGAPFGRYLRSKAAHVHEKPQHRLAILLHWLSICFPAGGRTSFRKMLCKSQQGFLLITDRYPQVEVPGFRFDARNWQKPRAVTVG
ncbi:nucleoside triphosphate hydrolase domain [Escherichia coli]|uniref:Nucleoside triphosphate hydrolase domain n=1 Tax=Escherichia coli TaxID=562 RepID=A0A2X1NC44_ECOLX|nr:nucleoside triphosphate hydrolase domain [Escherichia coli]